MPFLLVRNDITKMQVDAVVNPANCGLNEGAGTSRAIYLAAGEEKLKAACAKIGHCDLGKAVMTKGFSLPARYIIHAVGPVWQGGGCGEEQILYDTYTEALKLAKKCRAKSVAFPLLSSGSYGYPKDQALRTAIAAISDFLLHNEMLVYMVLYDKGSVLVSRKLFQSIETYIDDHYVEEKNEEYCPRQWGSRNLSMGLPGQPEPVHFPGMTSERFPEADTEQPRGQNMKRFPEADTERVRGQNTGRSTEADTERVRGQNMERFPEPDMEWLSESDAGDASGDDFSVLQRPSLFRSRRERSRKLENLMKQMGETFSQMLLRLIDERGFTDAEVYHRANIDRRHFSKIRTKVDYIPNKKTVMAFAVALELSLDEAEDLLRTAGFSFSDSSKFDVIIRFFLENQIYDVFEINEVLFAYEQPLIGG